MIELYKRLPDLFRAYGQPAPVEKLHLSAGALDELQAALADVPAIDWTSPNLSQKHLNAMAASLQHQRRRETELAIVLDAARLAYEKNGACIIRFDPSVMSAPDGILKKQIVYALQAFGTPFGIFNRMGFWQVLGVNHAAKNLRAESTGYMPLHYDFDQATNPPDGFALFCVRPDPRGGGESTLFDYRRFLSLLSDKDKATLSNIRFSYAGLYDQNGIGDVYNPHPLLERRPGREPVLRYNGKIQPDLDGDMATLFTGLEQYFRAHSAVIPLKPGQMLMVNQDRMLHGRDALNMTDDTKNIPASKDRYILQAYLRHTP
jgi:hypothetical protein